MNITKKLLTLLLGSGLVLLNYAASPLEHFITRDGSRLLNGTDEYRFVGANFPDALQIISNYRFNSERPADRYRLPDEFELRDCVRTVRQMGGLAFRTFVLTCTTTDNPAFMFKVSQDTVTPNEDALRVIDKLLQICHEEGVRVYIPLIAYRSAVRGDPSTFGPDFWTVGSRENALFKLMVTQVINRTNTYTGVRYRDDTAILGWHTGNELVIGDDADRRNWLHDIAAFLKKIDPNHLVIDGRNKPIDIHGKYDEFLDDENIDAVSYHTYVNLPEADTTVGTMRLIHEQLHERKVLLISEIAMYTSTKVLRDLFEEMIELNIPGANWWGLRFHNRDGGFYKHSDRGSKYEDLNWPGFSSAESAANSPDLAHEHDVLALLSEYAARINGRSPAPTAVPATPVMLPAADVGHLSWQGSTGANGYDVQRAPTSEGPWITIAANVGDHLAPYDALFYDGSAALNTDLFYRVIARNSAGASAPSDALGPLRTDRFWIVDDQLDATKWGASSENLKIVHTYLHSGNIEGVDVAQRTDPTAPGRLHYRVPGTLRSFHVFAYATAVPPRFYVINAAGERHNALPTPTAFQDDRRTRYDLTLDRSDAVGLEIELPANASASQAIGRVELTWVPIP